MSEQTVNAGGDRTARIYRMMTPDHTCPYGL